MSAATVHTRLLAALRDLQRAERNAVLLFGEILRRKLYRDLGYASIQAYAAETLGFTPSKTSQFVRLAGALKELPHLRRSVAAGELGWTKAREVAKVATPHSEQHWITEAKRSSSRRLELKVRATRQQARQAARVDGQPTLALGEPVADPIPEPAPVTVSVTFTPEQYARYEALLETIRKRGGRRDSSVHGMDRAELLLAALNDMAGDLDRGATAGSSGPPYQVVVYTCKECGAAEVQTERGPQPICRPRSYNAMRASRNQDTPTARPSPQGPPGRPDPGWPPLRVAGVRADALSRGSSSTPALAGRRPRGDQPAGAVCRLSPADPSQGWSMRNPGEP